jgi:hypothetical protein
VPGLVPGIHVLLSCFVESPEDVMAGTSPAMTAVCFHQHIVYDYGEVAMFRAKNPRI